MIFNAELPNHVVVAEFQSYQQSNNVVQLGFHCFMQCYQAKAPIFAEKGYIVNPDPLRDTHSWFDGLLFLDLALHSLD